MRFKIHFLLLAVAGIVLLKPTTAVAQSGPAAEMLQLINQFRVDNGLPPFQANAALVAAAQNQASYMAENGVFSSHVGYGGSTPQTRANAAGYIGFVSENIVGGTGLTPRQGLTWWRNSPVHYNTLVTARYTEAGTAFSSDGESNFFVLVVGRKVSSTTPPSSGEDSSPEPLIVTPIVLAEPQQDGSIVHIVQDGQALWSLAAHYDVALNDLLLYNNLSESQYLQPGDSVIIRLPDGAPPPATPTPPLRHVVQQGQSLWSIAIRYDVRFADLLLFNNLTEDSLLQPGDEIVIRLAEGEAPPPTPTPVIFHSIQSGETLWDIALWYGLDLDGLLALNEGLTADAILQIGSPIRVRQEPATPEPTWTPTPVSPTQMPTETAVPPTRTATRPSELAQVSTPAPPSPPVQTAQTRSLGSGLFYGIAALLAVFGVAFVWWANRDAT